MRLYRYYFFIFLFVSSFRSAYPQQKDSAFALVYLSNSIQTDLNKLKEGIAEQKSLDQVKNLVLKTVSATEGLIVVTFIRGNSRFRWQRRFGETKEGKPAEWIVLGRRGDDEITLVRAAEFRKQLKDTVIFMDTLFLSIKFTEPALDINGYRLRIYENKGSSDTRLPGLAPATLLIPASIARKPCKEALQAELYGKSTSDILLASFYISSPCAEQITEWLSIARNLKSIEPKVTVAELSDYLQSYISDNYPGIRVLALTSWLAKNM